MLTDRLVSYIILLELQKEVFIISENDLRLLKGKQTKNKILMAALNILAEEGIKGLSASRIAKRAGISKSNVFHHFSTIEDIPLHVLRLLSKIIITPLEERSYDSLEDYFTYLGSTVFNAPSDELKYHKAFFSFYSEATLENNDRYKELLIECKNAFATHVKEIILELENVRINDNDLVKFCYMITISIDGFGLHFLTDGNANYYTELWRIQSNMLCNWIRQHKI